MTELSTDAPPAGEANSDDELNPTALVPTTNAPVPAKVVPLLQGVTPTMAALARAATSQEAEDPSQFAEIRRICAVNVVGALTPGEVEEFTRRNAHTEAFTGTAETPPFRFNEVQARGVLFFDRYGGLFAACGCSTGKCTSGDTEVFDAANGRRATVAEMVGKPFKVNALVGNKIALCDASAFESGQKPCVKVKLTGGQSVTLSIDHPVLCERGWIRADGLIVGELVATPRKLLTEKETEVSDHLVRFCAYMLADGSTSHHPQLTDDSPSVLADLDECARALGGTTNEVFDLRKVEGDPTRSFNVNGLKGLVEKMRLRGTSHTKRVPAEFYGLPLRQTAMFLHVFWACDGYFEKNDVGITLTSGEMIDDIRVMLLRLGIHARKRLKKTSWTYKGVKKRSTAWRLSISDMPSVRLFFELVGVPADKKNPKTIEALRSRAYDQTRRVATNVDVVPFRKPQFFEMLDEMYPLGPSGAGTKGAPRVAAKDFFALASSRQCASRRKLQAWIDKTGYSGKFAAYADADIMWTTVESVTPCGTLPVFDLSVPAAGNFVANGVFVHNTLLTIMIAERHWRRVAAADPRGRNTSLLLIPPEVYDQFTKRIGERPSDIQWARARVPVTVPFIGLGGKTQAERLRLAKTQNGCFVMPHSLMSTRDTTALLEVLQPSLVQVDEAHKFKNRDRARTKRLMNYVAKKRPKFVVLSGSMTSKSLKNHHHFMEPTVGERSPLPLSQETMLQWAAVVDSDADPTDDMKKPLEPLVDWARHKFAKINFRQDISGFRLAQQLRLWSAPGVVATQDSLAPCALILSPKIAPHVVPEQEEALWALMRQVDGWTTPNGDPIEDARQKHGWLYQLSAGFYYRLTWPTVEEITQRQGLSTIEAKDLLGRSIERHVAHGLYSKALRAWFESHPHYADGNGKPLDTPFGVGVDMLRNKSVNVGHELYDAWLAWKRSGIEPGSDPFAKGAGGDLLERDSVAIPICDYKIRAALAWAKGIREAEPGAGAIVWYYHQHVGEWLTKVLQREFGQDVLHCPAGDAANKAILNPANAKRITVASWRAHGTGKNLQHYYNQIVVQWPRSANDVEQFLSRTHRRGQLADELAVTILIGPPPIKTVGEYQCAAEGFDDKNIAASMRDATYIQQILGNRQRALAAQWSPLPRMFDQNTLLEMGFETDKLGAKEEQFLKEKFG